MIDTSNNSANDTLIDVQNLRTYFPTDEGVVKAVDDVSLRIPARQNAGAGRRKRLRQIGHGHVDHPADFVFRAASPAGGSPCTPTAGRRCSRKCPSAELRKIRGGRISMIFQEPMTSLNPVFTIGQQIGEAVRLHQKRRARPRPAHRAIEMLRKVKIPAPERRVDEYPHQMSGGMRQRVMIAMALSCHPALLIADEPTTALDVTIQAQILDLLRQLQSDVGMSILMITHDLGIVAEMADDVAVMYASKVVERAPVDGTVRPAAASLHGRPVPIAARAGQAERPSGSTRSPAWSPARCIFPRAASFTRVARSARSRSARRRSRSCERLRPAISPAAISPASWISWATKTNRRT